jgi:hypothetical protein
VLAKGICRDCEAVRHGNPFRLELTQQLTQRSVLSADHRHLGKIELAKRNDVEHD